MKNVRVLPVIGERTRSTVELVRAFDEPAEFLGGPPSFNFTPVQRNTLHEFLASFSVVQCVTGSTLIKHPPSD